MGCVVERSSRPVRGVQGGKEVEMTAKVLAGAWQRQWDVFRVEDKFGYRQGLDPDRSAALKPNDEG